MARRFLTFEAAGARYALKLEDVAEVMEPRDTFPLPVAPPCYRGLINFHGALTAVLDLAMFLGRGGGKRGGKFLVLDGKIASLALWVDGVGSIVGEEGILSVRGGDDPLLEALLETEGGEIRLFDVEALLSSLEEGVAAASPVQDN